MSVRKRKDGRWQISFYYNCGGERVRHREAAPGARNRSEALAYEARRRAELEATAAHAPKGGPPIFEAFAGEFVDTYAVANNKPSEVASKRLILEKHLVPFFGPMKLDQIGPQQIESFKATQLRAGLSPKTINNQLAVLGKLLTIARDWKRIANAPRVGFLATPDPEFDFLDFDEAARLAAAADPDWRPMILLAMRTGLRQGELLELRWDDVDLVKGMLRVRRSIWKGQITTPKGRKPREVPLSDEARAALRSLPSRFAGALVFPAPGAGAGTTPAAGATPGAAAPGRHLTKGECKHPLYRACRRAGLRRIGWHVLRHTFASHLAMRGVPMKAIQELLGHTTLEMTMRYAHLSPDVRRDAVSLLDAPAPDRRGHELGTVAAGSKE